MVPRYPFTPPNRAAVWASLALAKAQLGALCGVTERQVSYWTAQGYLPRSTRDPRRYSGDAIDMAMLIQQGRQQGLSVYEAAQQARADPAAEQARQAEALATIASRVAQAGEAVRQVLRVVAPRRLVRKSRLAAAAPVSPSLPGEASWQVVGQSRVGTITLPVGSPRAPSAAAPCSSS